MATSSLSDDEDGCAVVVSTDERLKTTIKSILEQELPQVKNSIDEFISIESPVVNEAPSTTSRNKQRSSRNNNNNNNLLPTIVASSDLSVHTVCLILHLTKRNLDKVAHCKPHAATNPDVQRRLYAVELLTLNITILAKLSCLFAVLLDNYSEVKPSSKRMKKDAASNSATRIRNTIVQLHPPSPGPGSRLGFDKISFQLVKCIHYAIALTIESSANHITLFTDDWEPEVKVSALKGLDALWEPLDILYNDGCWQINSQISPYWSCPLRNWPWLRICTERLSGPTPNDVTDETPSEIPPGPAKQYASLEYNKPYSRGMERRIRNSSLGSLSSLAQFNDSFKFLNNITPTALAPKIHELLKRLCGGWKYKTDLVYQASGWLIRAMEDPSPDTRLFGLHFLSNMFKHDLDSIHSREKFNLPLMDLMYDQSDLVRAEATNIMILFAAQQPFKDGAFKRFDVLLHSRKADTRRTALRLISFCKGFNVTAIKEAFKTLISVVEDMKQFGSAAVASAINETVHAAANFVQTNQNKALDIMALVNDSMRIRFPENENRKLSDTKYAVFCAMALSLLEHAPGVGLRALPGCILNHYGTFKRRYPDRFKSVLLAFPPSRRPVTVTINPNQELRATNTRNLEDIDLSWTNNYLDKNKITITAGFPAAESLCPKINADPVCQDVTFSTPIGSKQMHPTTTPIETTALRPPDVTNNEIPQIIVKHHESHHSDGVGVMDEINLEGLEHDIQPSSEDHAMIATENLVMVATENLAMAATENLAMAANENLAMAANENLAMAANENLVMTGSEDLVMTGSEDLVMTGSDDLVMTGSDDLVMTGSEDLVMTGSEDLVVCATQGDPDSALADRERTLDYSGDGTPESDVPTTEEGGRAMFPGENLSGLPISMDLVALLGESSEDNGFPFSSGTVSSSLINEVCGIMDEPTTDISMVSRSNESSHMAMESSPFTPYSTVTTDSLESVVGSCINFPYELDADSVSDEVLEVRERPRKRLPCAMSGAAADGSETLCGEKTSVSLEVPSTPGEWLLVLIRDREYEAEVEHPRLVVEGLCGEICVTHILSEEESCRWKVRLEFIGDKQEVLLVTFGLEGAGQFDVLTVFDGSGQEVFTDSAKRFSIANAAVDRTLGFGWCDENFLELLVGVAKIT